MASTRTQLIACKEINGRAFDLLFSKHMHGYIGTKDKAPLAEEVVREQDITEEINQKDHGSAKNRRLCMHVSACPDALC